MDRYLLIGAVLLLILESLWLAEDLGLVDVHLFTKSEISHNSMPIGKVLQAKKNVRRRGADSLLWEDSQGEDTLYYYDSVLTLNQSAATLKVESETQVNMSENTLVVLEPSDDPKVDRLKLIFAKGDVRAKNPNKDARIDASTWTIEAVKGSELNLRADSTGKMEVEILKGSAQLAKRNPAGEKSASQKVDEGVMVTLSPEQIEKQQRIANDIAWEKKEGHDRVYAHAFPVSYALHWSGDAEELDVTDSKDQTQNYKVVGIQQTSLQLTPGLYQLRLKKGEFISSGFKLEVWQAPIIHLLSPLPRDRIQKGVPTTFSWSQSPLAQAYQPKFSLTADFADQQSDVALSGVGVSKTFSDEADWNWRVEAIDPDNFKIPALYSNPFFVVDDPLAAPKLKSVKTRRPAQERIEPKPSPTPQIKKPISLLWEWWFGNEARAQEVSSEIWEAEFSWEQVEGANHYIIEISDAANFQKTQVNASASSTSFVWRGFKPGTYYWRVAAVKPSGQVGLFSEPASAQLIPDTDSGEGVTLRRVTPTPPPPTPTPTPTPQKPTPSPTPEAQNEDLSSHGHIWAGPGLQWAELRAQESARARLLGVNTQNLGGTLEFPKSPTRSVRVTFAFSRTVWKPSPADAYPFQDPLNDFFIKGNIYWVHYAQNFNMGLAFQRTNTLVRTDLETLELRTKWLVGPAFMHETSFGSNAKLHTQFSITAESHYYDFWLQNHYFRRQPLSEIMRWTYGMQINGGYMFSNENPSSWRAQWLWILGLEW